MVNLLCFGSAFFSSTMMSATRVNFLSFGDGELSIVALAQFAQRAKFLCSLWRSGCYGCRGRPARASDWQLSAPTDSWCCLESVLTVPTSVVTAATCVLAVSALCLTSAMAFCCAACSCATFSCRPSTRRCASIFACPTACSAARRCSASLEPANPPDCAANAALARWSRFASFPQSRSACRSCFFTSLAVSVRVWSS